MTQQWRTRVTRALVCVQCSFPLDGICVFLRALASEGDCRHVYEWILSSKLPDHYNYTSLESQMDSATALINALAGEEQRWTNQSKEFDSQIQRLTGACADKMCV